MVSKRLDKWRRDISEKRRKGKSKRYYIPMKLFNSKPPQKRMAKLKCSTYLPHIFSHLFFRFSLNFPKCQNLKLFPSQVDGCLQAHWEPQDFLLQWILLVQKYIDQLHGFCVNRSTASAMWHTNAFVLSAYQAIWCQVFFCSYPRKKFPRKPERNPCGETVSTRTAWNRWLTSSENTVPADPTPAVDSNLFLKDDRYWKLRQKLTTNITT